MRYVKIPIVYPDIKQNKIKQILIDHKCTSKFPVFKVKRIILNVTENNENETNNSIE